MFVDAKTDPIIDKFGIEDYNELARQFNARVADIEGASKLQILDIDNDADLVDNAGNPEQYKDYNKAIVSDDGKIIKTVDDRKKEDQVKIFTKGENY